MNPEFDQHSSHSIYSPFDNEDESHLSLEEQAQREQERLKDDPFGMVYPLEGVENKQPSTNPVNQEKVSGNKAPVKDKNTSATQTTPAQQDEKDQAKKGSVNQQTNAQKAGTNPANTNQSASSALAPPRTVALSPDGQTVSVARKNEQITPNQPNGPSVTQKQTSQKTTQGQGSEKGQNQNAMNGGGGGGGGRLTEVTVPSLEGKAEAHGRKMAGESGQPRKTMLARSKEAYDKEQLKIKKTKDAQQKTKSAKTKSDEAEKARVIHKKDTQSETDKAQVGQLSDRDLPQIEKSGTRQKVSDLRRFMGNAIPTNVDQLKSKTHMQKLNRGIEEGMNQVKGNLQAKTAETRTPYQAIKHPAQGEQPRRAQPLPGTEKALNTPLLAMNSLQTQMKVPEEQLESIRQTKQEADQVLQKEGIGEGQAIAYDDFRQAKSEDLRRGIKDYDGIQKEADKGPADIRKKEQQHHSKMARSVRSAEGEKRTQMRKTRDEQLKASRGEQGRAKSAYEEKKAAITKEMQDVFKRTQTKVTGRLQKLDGYVKREFKALKKKATDKFTEQVKSELSKFHLDRYFNNPYNLIPIVLVVNIGRSFFEDTSNLEEVKNIFRKGKDRFIEDLERGIDRITRHVDSEVAACKQMIDEADGQLKEILDKQDPQFKKVAQDAYDKIHTQLEKLDKKVEKKAEELKQYLEKERKKAIEELDKLIEKMKERLKGALNRLASFLLDAAYKFFKWVLTSAGMSVEQIDKIIQQGKMVLTKIVTDPVGFFQNLASAVMQGFNNFAGNIGKHLKNGLFAWLTGAMAGAGIELPKKWDLQGIFSLVLQVLGLTWPNIRMKIAKEVGEERMAEVEHLVQEGFTLFQEIQQKGFVTAVWDMLAQKAEEIKQMVIGEIQQWIMVKVVQEAIKTVIAMLNPAGWIVKAIQYIYRFAMWLINNWQRIVQVISNIVQSIGQIAMGAISSAANFIENTLATFIPIVLDFLARLLNLGNVSETIQGILKKIRKPIDDLIEKIIRWVKNKMKSFGKKGKKGKKNTKEEDKKEMKKDKGKEGVTDVDRKRHKRIGEEIKRQLSKPPTSKVKSFKEFYDLKTKQAKQLKRTYQKQLKKGVKLDITFKSFSKEKVDNDIDFKISIRQNNYNDTFYVNDPTRDARFAQILHNALKTLGNKHYKPNNKEGVLGYKEQTSQVNASKMVDKRSSIVKFFFPGNSEKKADKNRLKDPKKDKEINEISNKIQRELAKAQQKYSNASKAEVYDNNTFRVGRGSFFVAQNNNYYIVPHDNTAKQNYDYFVPNMVGNKHNMLSALIRQKRVKYERDIQDAKRKINMYEDNPGMDDETRERLLKTEQDKVDNAEKDIIRLDKLKTREEKLKHVKSNASLFNVGNKRLKIGFQTQNITSQYDYGRNPLAVKEAQKYYRNFPNSIKDKSKKTTIFLASVLVEPNRNTIAHITNALLLNKKSKLPSKQRVNGRIKNVNTYQHLSMTQSGSDPYGLEASRLPKDPRLGQQKLPKIVTEREFASIKTHNKTLYDELKKTFEDHEAQSDGFIRQKLESIIETYIEMNENS